MATVRIPAGSVEYVNAEVTGDVTLDTQPVEMAFAPAGRGPIAGDWAAAAWVGVAGTTRTCRRITTGAETAGSYGVYVRVTDSPEIPIIRADTLIID